jgi:ABC-2 type transport system permease protein
MTYLQNGGKLLLVTGLYENGVMQPNLEAIMADYGVTQEDGIVIEGDENYTVWSYNYYLLPDLNPASEITAPLAEGSYRVLVPVAKGMSIEADLREGLTVTGLLTTSESSFVKPEGWGITSYEKAEGDLPGPFYVALTAEEGDSKIVMISSANMLDDNTILRSIGSQPRLFPERHGLARGRCKQHQHQGQEPCKRHPCCKSGESAGMSLIIVGLLPLALMAIGIFVFVRRKRR